MKKNGRVAKLKRWWKKYMLFIGIAAVVAITISIITRSSLLLYPGLVTILAIFWPRKEKPQPGLKAPNMRYASWLSDHPWLIVLGIGLALIILGQISHNPLMTVLGGLVQLGLILFFIAVVIMGGYRFVCKWASDVNPLIMWSFWLIVIIAGIAQLYGYASMGPY